jgi:hypothetical protein
VPASLTLVSLGFHNANLDSKALHHLKVQRQCCREWETLHGGANMEVIPYVEDVVERVGRCCRSTGHRATVLVIGSVHLIGAFYQVLDIDASIDICLAD